ncbi:MAG: adenylyl-sulfate kinase [bacterium]|nr:adenylyl-sulfate kinase [bacterium]
MSVLNITPQDQTISRKDRNQLSGNKSFVIWFTGLSGSGKSTLANKLEEKLFEKKIPTYLLDGDNIRLGLNKDLSFTEQDRKENIRRIGEVSKLFVDSGIVVLTAFISPFRAERNSVRELLDSNDFIEVFVKCSLDVCEDRDVKGLYKKARSGEIKNFTGIDSPYEEPADPEIVIDTNKMSPEESVDLLMKFIEPRLSLRN